MIYDVFINRTGITVQLDFHQQTRLQSITRWDISPRDGYWPLLHRISGGEKSGGSEARIFFDQLTPGEVPNSAKKNTDNPLILLMKIYHIASHYNPNYILMISYQYIYISMAFEAISGTSTGGTIVPYFWPSIGG